MKKTVDEAHCLHIACALQLLEVEGHEGCSLSHRGNDIKPTLDLKTAAYYAIALQKKMQKTLNSQT